MSETLNQLLNYVIEYETPKVVTVHNVSIGLIRRGLQLLVVLYVTLYQLWYAQGYQEFSTVESSTTTKVGRDNKYLICKLVDSSVNIDLIGPL